MKATVVDFRYKMPKILRALRLREPVTLYYHGKAQGTLVPVRPAKPPKLENSPVFGMYRDDKRPIKKIMDELRAPRYRAH